MEREERRLIAQGLNVMTGNVLDMTTEEGVEEEKIKIMGGGLGVRLGSTYV